MQRRPASQKHAALEILGAAGRGASGGVGMPDGGLLGSHHLDPEAAIFEILDPGAWKCRCASDLPQRLRATPNAQSRQWGLILAVAEQVGHTPLRHRGCTWLLSPFPFHVEVLADS